MYGRTFLRLPLLLALAGVIASASALVSSPHVAAAAPIPVTLIVGGNSLPVQTSAPDVGALLEEQNVTLGQNDIVYPSLADRISAHQTIRVTRVTRWTQTARIAIAPKIIRRFTFSIARGKTKVLARGSSGTREVTTQYEERDNRGITHTVASQRVLRRSRPRIVAVGETEYDALLQFTRRGLTKTAYVASRTLRMVATAYTAGCSGCSGITAIGRRAGHGIVAVDPRYIPLGTHLYIPGYGLAIAGDTGGSIRGNRIDLGFNSNSDAMQFGRRAIVVYQLR